MHRLSPRSNTLSIVYCVYAKTPYGETDAARHFAFAAMAVLDGGIVLACEIRKSAHALRSFVEFSSRHYMHKQRYFLTSRNASENYAKLIFVICKLYVIIIGIICI